MKNLAGLMKQASQMQSKMEEAQKNLANLTVDGSAGAGLVTLQLTGKGEMRSLKIDPKLADPNEMEMLQDLIVAAYTDAKNKAEA
ncbi:nucleoid-associated protein, partial [Gluconobacter japonicus]